MAPEREEILKLAEEIRPAIERVAEKKGWAINPMKEVADSVIEGLARNQLLRGKRYCPCRLPSGNEETDKQFICPCRMSPEDVEKEGHCHCYLYLKK
ncbi:MAG TPA: ferredoxin:thioredoxin reductase [Methanocorpusculum sp.]|nr:ferredoxin:thioredoxin reductase [Methanocorpusculum sp.]